MVNNKAGALKRNAELMRRVVQLHEKGESWKGIARQVGLSSPTVSDFLRGSGYKPNRAPGKMIDKVGGDHARCSRCAAVKPLADWPTSAYQGIRRPLSFCRACYNQRLLAYANSSTQHKLKAKYVQLCARQRREGARFAISFEEFVGLWNTQRGKCFYTDTPLSINCGGGKKPNSLSVDRVDPDAGYVLCNVVLAANRINGMKGDASLAEMRAWMPAWFTRVVTYHYWDASPGIDELDVRRAA